MIKECIIGVTLQSDKTYNSCVYVIHMPECNNTIRFRQSSITSCHCIAMSYCKMVLFVSLITYTFGNLHSLSPVKQSIICNKISPCLY